MKKEMTMKAQVVQYIDYLAREEKSITTRKQYQRDILRFLQETEGTALTKELVLRYKEALQKRYQSASINTKIAALNGFFSFIGRNDLRMKQLRIQRRAYCSAEKELTKEEYLRLVNTAKRQENEKLSVILQTICGTGIRVSELQFITAEAVREGEALIRLKGKTRTILISGKLQKILKDYMKRKQILSGPLFVTRTGRPIDRSNIWKDMKALCERARVNPHKVFPHNLRHLFARCFYAIDKDIARLADILGHSNINTTRIYIISSGREHRQHMDALGLVV